MVDGVEYCNFCHTTTFLFEERISEESIAGFKVITSKKEGKCKKCGRLIHIVEVKAIEENNV